MSRGQEPRPLHLCSILKCKADADVVFGFDGGLCAHHADRAWRWIERRDADSCHEPIEGAEAREYERADCRAKRRIEKRKPTAMGEIYYVHVNGLIKVGWTSVLADRIRSYGPTARLLANYPATRADESHLHRQLTPSRAKGREWYHDDAIVRAFIALVVRQHGPPRFAELEWTQPKQVVAGKRHR